MRDTPTRIHAFSIVIACGLLAACASSGPASNASALVGKYQVEGTIAIFNADGTYVGTTVDGRDWVKGTYTVDGNMLTMTDTWEDSKIMTSNCMGITGRYTWELKGDTLTAQAVEDACEGRKQATSGTAWKRVP